MSHLFQRSFLVNPVKEVETFTFEVAKQFTYPGFALLKTGLPKAVRRCQPDPSQLAELADLETKRVEDGSGGYTTQTIRQRVSPELLQYLIHVVHRRLLKQQFVFLPPRISRSGYKCVNHPQVDFADVAVLPHRLRKERLRGFVQQPHLTPSPWWERDTFYIGFDMPNAEVNALHALVKYILAYANEIETIYGKPLYLEPLREVASLIPNILNTLTDFPPEARKPLKHAFYGALTGYSMDPEKFMHYWAKGLKEIGFQPHLFEEHVESVVELIHSAVTIRKKMFDAIVPIISNEVVEEGVKRTAIDIDPQRGVATLPPNREVPWAVVARGVVMRIVTRGFCVYMIADLIVKLSSALHNESDNTFVVPQKPLVYWNVDGFQLVGSSKTYGRQRLEVRERVKGIAREVIEQWAQEWLLGDVLTQLKSRLKVFRTWTLS